MANRQEFETIVRLNAKEAENNVERLKKKIEDLKAARDKAIASKSSTNFVKDVNKDLKAAQSELKSYETNVQRTIKTINDVEKASLGSLEKAVRALRVEMRQVNNPKDYQRLDALLQRCKSRIEEIKSSAAKVVAEEQSMTYAINRYEQEVEQAQKSMALTRRETALVDRTLRSMSTASIRELEFSLKIVNERLRGMSAGTAEFQRMQAQAKALKAQLDAISQDRKQESWVNRLADGFNRFQGIALSAVAAVTGLSLSVRKTVQDFADMEEAMANTRKYTGQADEEVRRMNEDFKAMDTRTSREELNELAGAAGRLGITSTQSIEEFVDAADKIGVALGDDLGDGAVDQIGKLAMAFGEDDKMGLRGAMLATGSAVNELAQNSAAAAGYLVDYTARVAGVGKQMGLTQADIMGFGAVMDENMLRDEMASTAFSQLLTKMSTDTKTFARLAGKSVKDFAKLLKVDANEAVLTLMESLRSKGGFDEVAKMFGEMGLDGARAVGVLTTMADKVDDVRKHQETANRAYEEGVSVINEFNVQNNTVQAQLDKAAKGFREVTVELGEKLMPVARYGITTGKMMIQVLGGLVSITTKYGTTLVTLTAAIAACTLARKADVIATKLQAFWTDKLKVALSKLWAVVKANPYAALVVAVIAVVETIVNLTRKTDEQARAEEMLTGIRQRAIDRLAEEKQKTDALIAAAKNENVEMSQRKKVCEQLNKIIPNFNAHIDETTGKFEASTEALKAYNEELLRKYEIEGAEEELAKLGKEKFQLTMAKTGAESQVKEAQAFSNQNAQSNKPLWARTTSQAETSFMNQNLSKAQERLDEYEKKLKDVQKAEQEILGVYGDDIAQKNASKATQQDSNGSGTSLTDKELIKQKRKKNKTIIAETNALMATLAQQYAQGEISYREYLDKTSEAQLDAIHRRMQLWGEGSDEYKNLLQDEQEATQQHEEDLLALSLEEIEKRRQQTALALQQEYYDRNSALYMNEDALNEALFENDMSAMADRLATMTAGTKEWYDLKEEMELADQEHQLELQQRYQEKLRQMRGEWGKMDVQEQEDIALKGLNDLHKKGLVSEEEYQQMLLQIRKHYGSESAAKAAALKGPGSKSAAFSQQVQNMINNAKANAGDAYDPSGATGTTNPFVGMITNYRNVMEQLRVLYGEDAANYNAYQQAKREVTSEFLENLVATATMAVQSVSQLFSAASSYYAAQSQYEQNVTTAKYDKMIEAAGDNQAKTKKLEEKKQKELAKIKTKYNKKQMKMEIAQAIASTALAAINAYASAAKINWALGAVAAALATAAGMIQIATIKKQHAAEEAGYYEGGYTGGSNYHREAGVVHEGEFVANHQAVNNPELAPAFRLLDYAQRSNTVGSLTGSDVSRALGQGGDTVITPVVNVTTDNEALRSAIEQMNAATARLNEQLISGIRASVSIDGQDGVKHQLDLFERMRNNV